MTSKGSGMDPGKGSSSATLDRHVAGTTQRWTFDEGPTKGKTYEHTFHEDGTVEFREVKGEPAAPSRGGDGKPGGGAQADRPQYGVAHVTDGVHAVSYLSKSGYTLTVVLDEKSGQLHGFASNDKEWYPVHGRFEQVS
jgi:hypothetical protein